MLYSIVLLRKTKVIISSGVFFPPAPYSVVGGGEKQQTILHFGFGKQLKEC